MRCYTIGTIIAAAMMFAIPSAQAQSQSAPLLLAPGPKACPPGVATPPQASNGKPLSEQLEKSKGVICPPAGVDPQFAEKPPPTGDNPVIPPPGSPGGNPNVVPKG